MPIVGKNPVVCVGHMFDKPAAKSPRFPISGAFDALRAYFAVLSDMHDNLPISAIITGGTHGGDSFAVWWALLHDVPLFVVRPYSDVDHLAARVPEGNVALHHFYQLMERAYQRADLDGRAMTLHPTIPEEFLTEAIFAPEQLHFLRSHNRVPSQVIAQVVGEKVLNDAYACYAWTNAAMLSLLSIGTRRRLVALWNGRGGNAPGGTEHAVRFAKNRLMVSPSIVTAGLSSSDVDIPIDLAHLVVAANA